MHYPENVTRLCGKKRFAFNCHPRVACFTECCRELELALSPYDVLRLCQGLHIVSRDFIERYVVVEEDDSGGFPKLFLGMVVDGKASCPFISESGCRVYENRPGSCRAYPVGRGATLDAEGTIREIHVLIHESHCQGFSEPDSHNVSEWFENQGLIEYNKINDEVLTLLQHEKARQGMSFTEEEKALILLALYRLDEFRKMVSTPAFQQKYLPDERQRASVLADDLNLLRFGIQWLKQVLFSEKA